MALALDQPLSARPYCVSTALSASVLSAPLSTSGGQDACRMLILECKLRLSRAQAAAIDEAIRTTQFIRNKALRLWMDGRGVGANELQLLCARLAQE